MVLKSNADESQATPEALMEYVAEQVATYKQIHHIEFIDAIPRNATGKVLKTDLRQRD